MSTDQNAGTERVATFLGDLARLTADQWVVVTDRHAKTERSVREAVELADAIAIDIVAGRDAHPAGQPVAKWREVVKEASARANAIVAALPSTEGKEASLRDRAKVAVWSAMRAIVVYDKLVANDDGIEAARTLLYPFEGLVSPP